MSDAPKGGPSKDEKVDAELSELLDSETLYFFRLHNLARVI
jgi:hypothetical protein